MIKNLENTIVAVSTPPGKGGIAIVRLSGKQAVEVVSSMFIGAQKLKNVAPWKAVLGKIIDDKRVIDEVIAIVYKAPHSYTREDMVEISCHGGMYVSQRILELAIKNGARLAEPGEFTFRAFLNGRIDLTQAEAVADIIQAQTEAGLRSSYLQLEGKLSQKISEIRRLLIDYFSLLEVELDFSEEDIEFVDRSDFILRLKQGEKELKNLIATYQTGRIARQGVKLVIAGKANVGKSSLMNMLAKQERAIVTDIPGTTRDSVEVQLDIRGILFRVVDTAGIKSSTDQIEREGISRAKKHLKSADIILHVFDGSQSLDRDDYDILNLIDKIDDAAKLRVINKSDLKQVIETAKLAKKKSSLLTVSALTGAGIENLEETLYRSVITDEKVFTEKAIVTHVRHWEALTKTLESVQSAREEAEKGVTAEFITLYLRDALNYLGQVTGEVTGEDILDNIFSKFCIGK